jgi:hypothetical protein
MYTEELKEEVIKLRLEGNTYPEIRDIIKLYIPKTTMYEWCKDLTLTSFAKKEISRKVYLNILTAQLKAVVTKRLARTKYIVSLYDKNFHLGELLNDINVPKIALAMLYLGEGSKNVTRITFCNSDPQTIQLFLKLFRACYEINAAKFRCTVQCRADQNTGQLEDFWYNITGIPRSQFYKTRMDSRTVGKPTQKLNYKGVCMIDYLSAQVFLDLTQTIKVLVMGR